MQSGKKHLHLYKVFNEYYEPSDCIYLRSTVYREYSQQLSDAQAIREISFYSYTNGDLILNLGLRTHLQYPYIEEKIRTLSLDEVEYDTRIIKITFNLNRSLKHKIENLFKQILQQLKTSGVTNTTEKYFLIKLKEYFIDFENDFVGGNKYAREGYPCQNHDKDDEDFSNKEAYELYAAVTDAEKDKVWNLLRRGRNPDTNFLGSSLLTAAVSIGADRTGKFSELLGIVILLLQYGANPNQKGKLGKTTEEAIVDISIRKEANLSFILQLIRYLKASKYSKPHIQVHESCQSPIAQLIRQGNFFLAEKKERQSTIYSLLPIQSAIPMQHIKAKDGKEIVVTTKEYFQLTEHEQALMFKLFKKYFPWQKAVNENELLKYFYKNFVDSEYQAFFDLLWINDILVGFNFAEISIEKDAIDHHIKLAVNSPSLSNYARLMTLISFQRSFVLQQKNPVITIYEAASLFSAMQAIKLDCYPLFAHDVLRVIKKFYCQEDLFNIDDRYYIYDELAYHVPNKESSFWLTQSNLHAKFYKKFIYEKGKSPIFIFPSSKKNFSILSELINPHLDGMTFESIIDMQAKDIKSSLEVRSKL